MSDLRRIACPKCHSHAVNHVEDVLAEREVLGLDGKGVLHVRALYEVWDDDARNQRLECEVCGCTFALDGVRSQDGVGQDLDLSRVEWV